MHFSKSKRGSVLITALIFAAIIAITLTSFLRLGSSSAALGNRSFYLNAAQNLLDTGFENTLWTLNDAKNNPTSNPTLNWTNGGFVTGTTASGGYQATFPTTSLSGGATGVVKVWTKQDTTTLLWKTVVKATVTLGDGSTIEKMAEGYLQQRSWSEKGMIARNGITFTGNAKVDSWISRPTPTSDIPYRGPSYTPASDRNYRCNANIACPAMVSLQNADVYGYAAIGTDNLTGIDCGSTGRLSGVYPGSTGIDASRVTYDFTSSFPDVDPPTSGLTALSAIAASRTFTSGSYTAPSISLSGGSDEINIGTVSTPANVVLVITGSVSLSGSARLVIPAGSSLTMYVAGDFSMGGSAGIENGTTADPNNPDCFTLLGTRTEAQVTDPAYGPMAMQDWHIHGGGFLSCVIFAPNGNVEAVGNGDIYGSLVGNTVTMVGNGSFHQDESLGEKRVSGLWKLLKWRELSTTTTRAAYATEMAF